jgi:hypothetical protein
VHVSDLANAHVAAIDWLAAGKPSDSLNLGNGRGFWVAEVVQTTEKLRRRPVRAEICSRRAEKGRNRVSASRLQHISQILQVPVPFFFEGAPASGARPAARAPADPPSLTYVTDFLATSDGLALMKAFMCVEDRKLRRAIVQLVEQITPEIA